MRKNTLKKTFALLVILAMLLPCIPVLASAEATVKTRTYEDKDMEWYGDGSATEFTISNAEELAYFMSLSDTFDDKTIKLDNDIVWNDGVASETGFIPSQEQGNIIYQWTPYANNAASSSEFKGIFDGAGHTIYGLYIKDVKYAGFFGQVRDGSVKSYDLNTGEMLESL